MSCRPTGNSPLFDEALAWGLPKPPVVLADASYGDVTAFREELVQRGLVL
jgi:SRSO17 transposase